MVAVTGFFQARVISATPFVSDVRLGKILSISVVALIKIEAWLVYFLYTKSLHFLHLTTLVYIFSIHQIYIKQNFVF